MTPGTDTRLARAIDARRDDLVALTQDLIRIPTLNPPGRNYREICDYLDGRLLALVLDRGHAQCDSGGVGVGDRGAKKRLATRRARRAGKRELGGAGRVQRVALEASDRAAESVVGDRVGAHRAKALGLVVDAERVRTVQRRAQEELGGDVKRARRDGALEVGVHIARQPRDGRA